MFSETLFIFMFTETLFEFMFAETLFNIMFTDIMPFGNPPMGKIYFSTLWEHLFIFDAMGPKIYFRRYEYEPKQVL